MHTVALPHAMLPCMSIIFPFNPCFTQTAAPDLLGMCPPSVGLPATALDIGQVSESESERALESLCLRVEKPSLPQRLLRGAMALLPPWLHGHVAVAKPPSKGFVPVVAAGHVAVAHPPSTGLMPDRAVGDASAGNSSTVWAVAHSPRQRRRHGSRSSSDRSWAMRPSTSSCS